MSTNQKAIDLVNELDPDSYKCGICDEWFNLGDGKITYACKTCCDKYGVGRCLLSILNRRNNKAKEKDAKDK